MNDKMAVHRQQELGVAKIAPTVAEMFQAVIEKGVTSENVSAVKEMAQLLREERVFDAEKQFATAFVELQKEMPKVQATEVINGKDGKMRSSFAPFEVIDSQARPICIAHGFTYTFSEAPSQPGKVTKVCILQHIGGHKREVPYSVRIGSGPPGCSESQSDGSAHSYAKRGALCDALNIVVKGIDRDADPRDEGGFITPEQAKSLQKRVMDTGSDAKAFLKFAQAETFEQIHANRYAELDSNLRRKEKTT